MANLTATDEDELLEIDEAKASDATPSEDELMMNILNKLCSIPRHKQQNGHLTPFKSAI